VLGVVRAVVEGCMLLLDCLVRADKG
jgi:hypothetical protein